ncbi:MAG: hypothetical protein JWP78_3709 [Mucilaginibacter sp.]|nr:hypothetical protein [Mucilaginibacter sp.]
MKKTYRLTLIAILALNLHSFSQTTLTEDANGVLNTGKVVTQTSAGQTFFQGHQLGSTYSYPSGIFRAWTDNSNGAVNYFYDGVTNGVTNFSVRADGQGYFAGNVGIGTTSPNGYLSLGSSISNKKLFVYDDGTGASGFGQAGSEFRIFGVSSGTNHISFGKYQLPNDSFTEQMRIDNSGNVSIGTSNANGYKFAVQGNVHAQQVTIDVTNWPDYVFKKDYQLPTLTEVKAYIDQNHHLPDMPSEQEVAKDGLNLGEMNKLLTKKVEELTLYLIEKDVKQKAQERINNKLMERLNEMEKKLNSLSNSGK